MPQRIQTAKARRDFANLVDRSARGERIKVTRYGRTLAALIPKSDLKKLEDCENKPSDEVSAPPNEQPLESAPPRRR